MVGFWPSSCHDLTMFTKFAGFITVIALALSGAVLVASPAGASTKSVGVSKAVAKAKPAKQAAHKKAARQKAKQRRAAIRTHRAVVPAPAAPVVAGRVGPGSVIAMGERECTAGLLFAASGRHYLSVSAQCAGRALGESVQITDAGNQVATGVLRYSGSDDFALVEVHAVAGVRLDGSVPGWGGPVGERAEVTNGERVYFATPSGVRSVVINQVGQSQVVVPMIDQTNRGAGLVDGDGKAVGLIAAQGEVLGLGDAVDGANRGGIGGLTLVLGGAFQSAAVG